MTSSSGKFGHNQSNHGGDNNITHQYQTCQKFEHNHPAQGVHYEPARDHTRLYKTLQEDPPNTDRNPIKTLKPYKDESAEQLRNVPLDQPLNSWRE